MICLKLGSWLASQKADKNVQLHCRSPHGERGLKYDVLRLSAIDTSRSPHGERGLKYQCTLTLRTCAGSLSSWRAWIEIPCGLTVRTRHVLSLSSWRAWIEITRGYVTRVLTDSRSPHGERGLKYRRTDPASHWLVRRSPHGERGLKYHVRHSARNGLDQVALLMESVD